MITKVLVVEESLAVRGIAESLLRQNGYEVYAAADAGEAGSIIGGGAIQLLLISSTVTDPSGRRLIDALSKDRSTAAIPFLILHDPATGELPYPPEAIICKPFTPREFVDAVTRCAAGHSSAVAVETPFDGAGVDDALIDAALGLDRLEVDEAKVFGEDTGSYRIQNAKPAKETMIGFEFKARLDDSGVTRRVIDQVQIRGEEVAPAGQAPASPAAGSGSPQSPATPPSAKAEAKTRSADSSNGMSASSQIEIVRDQYGMVTPPELLKPVEEETGAKTHDYDWFIKELKKESVEGTKPPRPTGDSGSIRVAPQPESVSPAPAPTASSRHEAIDKFISEFKKEIDNLDEAPVPSISISAPPPPPAAGNRDLDWQEAIEEIAPRDIKAMSRDLAEAVAARIAEQLLARIDQATLYRIIAECFREMLEKRLQK